MSERFSWDAAAESKIKTADHGGMVQRVTIPACHAGDEGSTPSITARWGLSSVGRASAWHAEGRGFKPHRFHQ